MDQVATWWPPSGLMPQAPQKPKSRSDAAGMTRGTRIAACGCACRSVGGYRRPGRGRPCPKSRKIMRRIRLTWHVRTEWNGIGQPVSGPDLPPERLTAVSGGNFGLFGYTCAFRHAHDVTHHVGHLWPAWYGAVLLTCGPCCIRPALLGDLSSCWSGCFCFEVGRDWFFHYP